MLMNLVVFFLGGGGGYVGYKDDNNVEEGSPSPESVISCLSDTLLAHHPLPLLSLFLSLLIQTCPCSCCGCLFPLAAPIPAYPPFSD